MNEPTSASQPSASLQQATEKLAIDIPQPQLLQIERYCRLLWKKNEHINLTRHTDWDTFAARDVLDSWHVAKLIESGEVLDIGSGGGVPGILVAILRPDVHVTCVDSVGKKTKVLEEFANALDLDMHIYQCRAEELLEDFRYDFCIARAVGSLTKMCRWFSDHWLNVGRLLAIKGPRFEEEINEANEKKLLRKLDVKIAAKYAMPNTENQSVILDICLASMRKKN